MIADKIVIPKFATESEEAEWLYENREEHSEIMAKAMAEGRTIPSREFWAKHGVKRDRLPVYLNADDIDMARRQAAARGIDTESYLQNLVHDAVNAAG